MKVSFFHLFAWLTRATPSLINLQIREKKYDFHNYVVVQITIVFVSMLTHIKLPGKNLQTNFDYTRFKGTHNKPWKHFYRLKSKNFNFIICHWQWQWHQVGTGKSDLHKQNVRVCFFSEQKCTFTYIIYRVRHRIRAIGKVHFIIFW
jgi:hypothetical protein